MSTLLNVTSDEGKKPRGPKTKTHGKNPEKKTSGSLERKVMEAALIQKRKPNLNGQVNIVDLLV